MKVSMTAMAPIAHSAFGAPTGNATLFRRMPIRAGVRCPVVSGNALRGVMRRVVMRRLFDACGLDLDTPGWDGLYAALANGGHLSGSEASVSPADVRALRAAVPPLSLFGAAVRSWMLAGRMEVGILWPQCVEAYSAGLVTGDGGGVRAEELLDDLSHVRHVDRDQQDPTATGVTPMPTTMETLRVGATLESSVTFRGNVTAVETAAAAWALDQLRSIGGKSAVGLGRVAITHDGDATPYVAWLEDAGAIAAARAALLALAEHIGGEKPKKRGKHAPAAPAAVAG